MPPATLLPRPRPAKTTDPSGTGGTLTTGDETAALRWASRSDVATLTAPAHAARVLDALDQAAPPAIRAHDGTHLL